MVDVQIDYARPVCPAILTGIHIDIATLVLRKDDKLNNSIVISEFTTRMTNKAQEQVIRSIRGLENARFVRYGRLHYNSFINSPDYLNSSYEVINYEVINDENLYVIGQLSGIDGYLAAISSAIVASQTLIKKNFGKKSRYFLKIQ